MGELAKWIGFLTFAGMGGASGYCFNQYAHQPLINDVGLVNQSAEAIDETLDSIDKQGNSYITAGNSTLPLTYALERMEIVKQSNPDKTENINKLIEEITAVKASKETLADPVLYWAAISGLKADLWDYAATNRDGDYIFLGCVTGFVSLLGATVIYEDRDNFD
jgi:hypothetical protein